MIQFNPADYLFIFLTHSNFSDLDNVANAQYWDFFDTRIWIFDAAFCYNGEYAMPTRFSIKFNTNSLSPSAVELAESRNDGMFSGLAACGHTQASDPLSVLILRGIYFRKEDYKKILSIIVPAQELIVL